MWGIWCFDKNDWLRGASRSTDHEAILAYETKRKACQRARDEYGFDTYTQTKREGWCEVRQLPTSK